MIQYSNLNKSCVISLNSILVFILGGTFPLKSQTHPPKAVNDLITAILIELIFSYQKYSQMQSQSN